MEIQSLGDELFFDDYQNEADWTPGFRVLFAIPLLAYILP
jgi:hypothetical protein